MSRAPRTTAAPVPESGSAATPKPREDPLYVRSIEKVFRVLSAFGTGHPTLSLAQVATIAEMDKSAAQRFTHTLERLGYLRKDPETRRFELTPRSLDLGYHYMRASPHAERAMPYLLELSRATEESVSLTVLDGTEIVYVVRFTSRHMVSTNVIVGTRLPVYCTAPGIALLSRLPRAASHGILQRSERRQYTPATTWRMPDLVKKLEVTAARGFAMAVEEIFQGDISLAAAVIGARGEPACAVSLSVSRVRLSPEEAEQRLGPLVVATANALSLQVLPAVQVLPTTQVRPPTHRETS
jgi:IclR family transcriptional regulator, pca regulon regulatory protein